jgi:hypothetical protein
MSLQIFKQKEKKISVLYFFFFHSRTEFIKFLLKRISSEPLLIREIYKKYNKEIITKRLERHHLDHNLSPPIVRLIRT